MLVLSVQQLYGPYRLCTVWLATERISDSLLWQLAALPMVHVQHGWEFQQQRHAVGTVPVRCTLHVPVSFTEPLFVVCTGCICSTPTL